MEALWEQPDTALAAAGLPASPRAADRVYAELKLGLLEGAYRAGERLQVEALGEALGVSKQPVMESLRRLSAEGLVVITPQVGCSVVEYDHDEVADYFQMMAAIEGAMTAMAAVRRTAPELEQLRLVSGRIAELLDEPSIESRAHGYRVMNRNFHGLIHASCGTQIVQQVGRSMMDRADFFINSSTPVSPLGAALADRQADHEAIVAAIAVRNAEAARQAASHHIAGTVELIRGAIAAGQTYDG
jgi:DNA-binding GntR family transcriptional regulator